MNYLQFDFITGSTEQSEQLIALLSEKGFEGFEEEEDGFLSAFIRESDYNTEELEEVIGYFPSLVYTKSVVENINWNHQWEQHFEPVLVGDFVGIRAGFHQPLSSVLHEIVITPKMSFGTGHHATTHLVIQEMQLLDFTGKKVLDFGTGTGVLAILAEKLGAASVLAIDNDEWSIANAGENCMQNNCRKIEISQAEAISGGEFFDIILANINLNVIINNLDAISAASQPGTQIILSGFLIENEDDMKEALLKKGLNWVHTSQRGDWIAMLVSR